MTRLRFTLLSSALFIVSAVIAFAFVSSITDPTLEGSGSDVADVSLRVQTPEDAREHAGFLPVTPRDLPEGWVAKGIQVNSIGEVNPKLFSVSHWNDPDASEFGMMLIQMPGSFDLGNAVDTTIDGGSGKRSLTAANPEGGRPYPLLSFQWSDGGFSYALTAKLSDTITEEVLQDVIASTK